MDAHRLHRIASGAPGRRAPFCLAAVLASLLALALAGCGDVGGVTGEDTSSGSRTYVATQTSGDVFVIKVSSDSFDIDNQTTGDAISGKVEKLDNQFQKWTVKNSTDPDVPTDGTGIAYALEIKKVALMLQPSGDDSDMIVGFSEGNCPDTSEKYNWVTIPEDGWDPAASDAWGTATSTVSGSNIAFQVKSRLTDGSVNNTSSDSGTCSDGQIDLTGGATIGVTESGAFLGSNGNGGGGFIGVIAPDADVSKSALTAAGIEYRGLVFKNQSSGDDTEPIWTRRKTDGKLLGGGYDDFENNVESSDTATLNLGTQSTSGVFKGTINLNGTTGDITFMANEIDGLFMIFGIADDPTDPGHPFNVLVMQVE